MRKATRTIWIFSLLIAVFSCAKNDKTQTRQPVYQDVAYQQDFSIKYFPEDKNLKLLKVASDRNGNIQILSNKGLLKTFSGKLLYPGKLVSEKYYRPLADKNIKGLISHDQQFVYLDDKAVLSNAWAGKLYSQYTLANAHLFSGGNDFDFLLSDGRSLQYVKDSKVLWEDISEDKLIDIRFDKSRNIFWILGNRSLFTFNVVDKSIAKVFEGEGFTCFTLARGNADIIIGTNNGYVKINAATKTLKDEQKKLPWHELRAVEEIDGKLWFGSSRGAFMLREDGKFNYYASQRWLPDDAVVDVAEGDGGSVLILTEKGLGKICFKAMTLYDKALFYEEQVRQRHIRYGFNSDMTSIEDGNVGTAQVSGHDSDNLWTSMYLGSQLFRYLVTHDEVAKQNCIESFEAMERVHTLAPAPGLFGRTFERTGIASFHEEYRDYVEDYWYPGYARTPSSWQHTSNSEWDWRGSASSDQTVGQYFALTLIAQYMDDEIIRQRAIKLIDQLTTYIVDNDLTIIDYDGKPSLWGRWNPEHVNRFPEMIGDRRLCSSNIIAFLQIAYHFTGKEKFKQKAEELLFKEGYLENLTKPIKEIGKAPADADNWSKMLSQSWNNSDDQMYFLAYWGLYPYALNDTLKEKYQAAIEDHWEFERSERDGLWNLCYAMTGAQEFDLEETAWFFREFPLDMIEWSQHNSHRKDIELVPENFREETTKEILPPDERPELKHNRNVFTLDKDNKGRAELGAGDTFLLPYWMGRFLGVISAPVHTDTIQVTEEL
jgi:hypothetical protein